MARTCQQVSGISTPANEQTQKQTHNGQYSAIDEVEEHLRRLSYVA